MSGFAPPRDGTWDKHQWIGPRPVERVEAGPGLGADDAALAGHDSDPEEAPRLRFRSAADVMAEPRPGAVVQGLAWSGRVTVLVSEPSAGKTFLLLDVAAAVDAGAAWHGRETRRGSVAYITYEGDALGLRLRALHEAAHPLDDVHVLRASAPLSPRVGRDYLEQVSIGEVTVSEALADLAARLAAPGRPPLVLVIVDTVRASLAGSEDSSQDVSAYLRAVGRVMAPYPAAACVLAHHAGWQDGDDHTRRKRERGSSALRGNVDATMYLEVTETDPEQHLAYLELRTLKVRDEERPAPLRLIRRRVELLASGDDGGPLTSCVIETDTRTREDREAAGHAAQQAQDRELDVRLLTLVRDQPEAATSARSVRPALRVRLALAEESIARCVGAGWLRPPDRLRQPYRLTAAGLEALGGPHA